MIYIVHNDFSRGHKLSAADPVGEAKLYGPFTGDRAADKAKTWAVVHLYGVQYVDWDLVDFNRVPE